MQLQSGVNGDITSNTCKASQRGACAAMIRAWSESVSIASNINPGNIYKRCPNEHVHMVDSSYIFGPFDGMQFLLQAVQLRDSVMQILL